MEQGPEVNTTGVHSPIPAPVVIPIRRPHSSPDLHSATTGKQVQMQVTTNTTSPPKSSSPQDNKDKDKDKSSSTKSRVAGAGAVVSSLFTTTSEFSDFVEAAHNSSSSSNGIQPGIAAHSHSTRDGTPTHAFAASTSPSAAGSTRIKVLIGSIEAGRMVVGEPLIFGPTSKGDFIPVSNS